MLPGFYTLRRVMHTAVVFLAGNRIVKIWN